MVAFAASSAGFNASLILNITDLLLAGISTPAAQFVDPEYEVSPLANIFFVIPSAVVLSLIITAVTEFLMVKRPASSWTTTTLIMKRCPFQGRRWGHRGHRRG